MPNVLQAVLLGLAVVLADAHPATAQVTKEELLAATCYGVNEGRHAAGSSMAAIFKLNAEQARNWLVMRGLIGGQRSEEAREIVELGIEQGRSAALACTGVADTGKPPPTQDEAAAGCAIVERCRFWTPD
ncbi:MAG TPA: hypothetical protein VEC14_12150 [Reyranellaceae bacterium]|nr:hypothetical protein [Reyranellaceae bacterium]